MGSFTEAKMVGFLCRICNCICRKVIHIYGAHGSRLCLEEKMNYLVNYPVDPFDNFSKILCLECVQMICTQYEAAKQTEDNKEVAEGSKCSDEAKDPFDEGNSGATSSGFKGDKQEK